MSTETTFPGMPQELVDAERSKNTAIDHLMAAITATLRSSHKGRFARARRLFEIADWLSQMPPFGAKRVKDYDGNNAIANAVMQPAMNQYFQAPEPDYEAEEATPIRIGGGGLFPNGDAGDLLRQIIMAQSDIASKKMGQTPADEIKDLLTARNMLVEQAKNEKTTDRFHNMIQRKIDDIDKRLEQIQVTKPEPKETAK